MRTRRKILNIILIIFILGVLISIKNYIVIRIVDKRLKELFGDNISLEMASCGPRFFFLNYYRLYKVKYKNVDYAVAVYTHLWYRSSFHFITKYSYCGIAGSINKLIGPIDGYISNPFSAGYDVLTLNSLEKNKFDLSLKTYFTFGISLFYLGSLSIHIRRDVFIKEVQLNLKDQLKPPSSIKGIKKYVETEKYHYFLSKEIIKNVKLRQEIEKEYFNLYELVYKIAEHLCNIEECNKFF